MKMTSDKESKSVVFSRIARICTLALFICIMSLIHFIYLWDRMPDSIKGLLIAGVLVSVVVALFQIGATSERYEGTSLVDKNILPLLGVGQMPWS